MSTNEQAHQIHEIYALCSTAFDSLDHFYDEYFDLTSIASDRYNTLMWIHNYPVMQDRLFGIYHVLKDALTRFDGIEGVETDRTRGIKELAAGMR